MITIIIIKHQLYNLLVTYKYIHAYVYSYIHIYLHTFIHAYIHTYVHKYIYTYVRICIHTYVFTYILDNAAVVHLIIRNGPRPTRLETTVLEHL